MDSEKKLAQIIQVPLRFKKIQIDNHIINYVIGGAGPPLLLIHGGNIGWGQWYPNIAELAKYFKVYAIDLPGGGRSSRVNYATLDLQKDLVEVVAKFITAIKLDKIDIIGSSIGGWIALQLVIKYGARIKKLMLVDSLGFSNYQRFADRVIGIYPLAELFSKTFLKPYRSNKNIEKFLRDVFYDKNVPLKREFIDYFYETMQTSHNLLFISRLSSFFGVRKEFILKKDLPKIKNETLITWGEKDKLMPVDKNIDNFKLVPNVRIRIIKNAGHFPSIERSEEFNKTVKDFLLH